MANADGRINVHDGSRIRHDVRSQKKLARYGLRMNFNGLDHAFRRRRLSGRRRLILFAGSEKKKRG